MSVYILCNSVILLFREWNVKPSAFFCRCSLEIYNAILESARVPHTTMYFLRSKTCVIRLKIENKNLYWKINKFKTKINVPEVNETIDEYIEQGYRVATSHTWYVFYKYSDGMAHVLAYLAVFRDVTAITV